MKNKAELFRKLLRVRNENIQNLVVDISLSGKYKDRISKNKESLLKDIEIITKFMEELKSEIESA